MYNIINIKPIIRSISPSVCSRVYIIISDISSSSTNIEYLSFSQFSLNFETYMNILIFNEKLITFTIFSIILYFINWFSQICKNQVFNFS